MTFRIEFTGAAEDDVFAIALWIPDRSVDAALRWEGRLRAAAARLSESPRR